MIKSCIYKGHVRHRRFTKRAHNFNYKLYMMFLNLDELPTLFKKYKGWSADEDRFNLARFLRRDHFGTESELKTSVVKLVKEQAGIEVKGSVCVLTHLRYLGYVFNPLCMYYCYDENNENVIAIVAEVSNTPWGEKHCYVLTDNLGSPHKHHYQHPKSFHVSPFLDMDMDYHWRLAMPKDKLFVHLENRRQEDKLFDATMVLQKEAITQSSLNKVLVFYPLMTVKIILAIHYEALKLWLKGVKYIPYKKNPQVEEL